MSGIELLETMHPSRDAQRRYDALVGIDAIKQPLLDELVLLLDAARLGKWMKAHHPKGLPVAETLSGAPLILLSGEVGCGKTALATSVRRRPTMSEVAWSSTALAPMTRTTVLPDAAGSAATWAITTFWSALAMSTTSWARSAGTVMNSGAAAPGCRSSCRDCRPS